MTEAARDPADLGDWTACPCGSPSGPEFRYGLCDPCAELTPASALLRMGQLFGNAALAASKSIPEIERLKAENASLRSMATALGKQCAELERDRDYNAELLAAAEQRAEAAEKERDEARKFYQDHDDALARQLAAAEQRNTALEGALRSLGPGPDGLYPSPAEIDEVLRAALHDEERRQGECVGHLGPPSNTATPHPKGDTCSFWKPLHDEERSASSRAEPPAGPSDSLSNSAAQGEEK